MVSKGRRAQSTGLRAQGKEQRAKSTEHRAQGTWHREQSLHFYNNFRSAIISAIRLSRIFSVSRNLSGEVSFMFTLK